MPVAKVENNATPPERAVSSGMYGDIYEALYKAEPNTWIAISITHTAESRIREIANSRRACQRFFAQVDIAGKYRMESRVDPIDEFNSIMYVLKKKEG